MIFEFKIFISSLSFKPLIQLRTLPLIPFFQSGAFVSSLIPIVFNSLIPANISNVGFVVFSCAFAADDDTAIGGLDFDSGFAAVFGF